MKSIFLLLSFSLMLINANAQDKVNIFISGKAAAHFVLNAEPVTISLKKFVTTKTKLISVNFIAAAESPYKQSLEITDEKEEHTSSINLQGSKQKSIYEALKKHNFFKGKKVKLFLLQSPANDMMLMPSKRIYLGELTIK